MKKHIIILRFLSKFTGNRTSQKFLSILVKVCLRLMGIGSGAGVNISGERSILDVINQASTNEQLVIFDGGANIGQFAQLAIKYIIKEDYIIHSFEPGKKTFQKLEHQLGKNKNVVLNNMGFGSKNEEKQLYFDKEGSTLASLYQRDLRQYDITMDKYDTVKITTIDDYCAQNRIQNINLLKLDLEGFEFEALKGTTKLLEEGRIDAISFEFGGSAIDAKYYFRDMYYLLGGYGYRIYRITPSGFKYLIKSYSEFLEQFSSTNYLAIK